MIGKIQSLGVPEGCAVRHLYGCNGLEQATQGHRGSIHTNRFSKRPHTLPQFLLRCPQNKFLICENSTDTKIREQLLCWFSGCVWLWYDPELTGGFTEKTVNTCKLAKDALNLAHTLKAWWFPTTKLHKYTHTAGATESFQPAARWCEFIIETLSLML